MKAKTRPFWVLSPVFQVPGDFPAQSEQGHSAAACEHCTLPPNPLMWYLPWPRLDPYSAKHTGELLQISRVPSWWISSLALCAVTSSPVNLLSLDAQLHLLTLGCPLGSTWICPSLCHGLETLSRQRAGAIIGLTSLVSYLTGTTGFHCLMSRVLFIYFVRCFSSFRCESKSSLCFSISPERRNLSWCIRRGATHTKARFQEKSTEADLALWPGWEGPPSIPK